MTNGFLDAYYALELAYDGHVEDIPDNKLEALRARYTDKPRNTRNKPKPKPQVKEELSERMIQIQDLWKRGLTVDEMTKETSLSMISIRTYLTKLKLPSNSIYHYRITRGEEIYFARSTRELAIKLNTRYYGARTHVRTKAREQGWELEYGDWREPEVRKRELKNE